MILLIPDNRNLISFVLSTVVISNRIEKNLGVIFCDGVSVNIFDLSGIRIEEMEYL